MSRNGKAGPAPAGGWLEEDQRRAWLAYIRVQDGELPVSVAEQEPGIRGAIRLWRYAAWAAEGIFSSL
jgi:hypothetical protein